MPQTNPTLPIAVGPLENFEDVRRVLGQLITYINAALQGPQTSFSGQRLTRLGTPVSSDDAATKGYVDGAVSAALSGPSSGTYPTAPIGVNVIPKGGGRGLVPSAVTESGGLVTVSSNINVTGFYSRGGTPGQTASIIFVKTVAGATFGTLTFSGGIIVGNS